ncbi:Ig-like domain-containing protein, partial [Xanthocytophaga agilis]
TINGSGNPALFQIRSTSNGVASKNLQVFNNAFDVSTGGQITAVTYEGGTAQPQGLVVSNNHHSEPFSAISSGASVSNNTQTTPALLRSGALALPYLSTAEGSNLIDKGTSSLPAAPIAMKYSGNSPDIGAYESGGTGIANQLPVVSLANPVANASYPTGSSINLTANASDADGSIAKVEFYVGSTKVGEKTSSPYSFSWNAATAGTYALTAKATDNKGGVTTSSAVNVTITSPNQAPTIAISSPANNTSFTSGNAITITANAADTDGKVGKVEFFAGTSKIGETTTAPYTINWTPSATGTYALTAKATDDKTGVATSTIVSVSVNAINKLPVVSLTAPTANATFTTGNVTVTASATDSDGSIAKVEFYVGSTKVGEKTSSPYSFSWNAATAGTYALTAKATDNKGGVTTSSAISVVINAPVNKAPVVALTSPSANAGFQTGATITATASATDSDGSIAKVEFYAGAVKIGEKTASPYSVTWSTTTVGTYSLTAKATDNKGSVTTSSAISVIVSTQPAANKLPVVSLANPVANASYPTGSSINLTANASDADGSIAKVEFYVGSTKVGEKTSSPYSFSWNAATAGTYALTAKATDNKGGVTTSSAVNVTITSPNQAPTIAISSPANNTSFTSGNAITITANAADTDGKVGKVEFFAGTSKIGETTTAPYTINWTPSATGTYALTAKATDDKTGVATSTIVSVSVTSGATATTGDGLNGQLYTQFGFTVPKTRESIAGQAAAFTFTSTAVDYPNGSANTSSYSSSWGSWLGSDGSGAPNQNLETSTVKLFGYIEIKPEFDVQPGNSTIDVDFTLYSQGHAAMTVNGVQVTINEENWAFNSNTARVSFAGTGFYTIEIIQSMCWDNAGLELYSSIPGTVNPGRGSSATPTIVPKNVLYKKIPTATAANSGRTSSAASLVAYPNPSNGDQVAFKIDDQSQNGQDMVVTFYNLNGNVAFQQNVEVVDGIIQLQNLTLNKGMYTVTVRGQKGIQHSKVVIQ